MSLNLGRIQVWNPQQSCLFQASVRNYDTCPTNEDAAYDEVASILYDLPDADELGQYPNDPQQWRPVDPH